MVRRGRIYDRIGYRGLIPESLRWAEELALAAAALIIGWIAVSVSTSVFARLLWNRPLSWTIEVSEYGLLFMTFLSIAAISRSHGHVRLEVVSEFANPRLANILDLFGLALGSVLGWSLGLVTFLVTYSDFGRGTRMDKILPVSRWIIVSAIPVGLLLFGAEQTRQFLKSLRRRHGAGSGLDNRVTEPPHSES